MAKKKIDTATETTPATETTIPPVQSEADKQKEQIKNTVKDLFKKVAKRDDLVKELEELNKELSEYGLAETPTKETVTVPRTTYADLTMESFTEFLKSKGGAGGKGKEIVDKFGQSQWNKFKKDNANKLRSEPDGVSKIWFLK